MSIRLSSVFCELPFKSKSSLVFALSDDVVRCGGGNRVVSKIILLLFDLKSDSILDWKFATVEFSGGLAS